MLRHAWILALLGAVVFLAAIDHSRIQRVETVTSLAADEAVADAHSATGWAEGRRWLIVPEHHDPTEVEIETTQHLLATGDWRPRRLELENAPAGRELFSASPYRWWLAAVAAIDHLVQGYPIGRAVESAALAADPILQLLLLLGAAVYAARRFGWIAAIFAVVGLAAFFPFGAAFLPGIATDFGLEQICLLWSGLLILDGLIQPWANRRAFIAAGAAGGLALWLSATSAVPILLGTAAGGMLAAWVTRGRQATFEPAWRSWSFAGAAVSLAGYLIENFPGHLHWEIRINHPLYAVAWLGLGELLLRFAAKCQTNQFAVKGREWPILLASALAVAALPIAIFFVPDHAFLAGDLWSTRLAILPDAPVAANFSTWLAAAPSGALVLATLLPAAALAPALWRLVGMRTDPSVRSALTFSLGPAAAALVLAFHHLRWWSTVDVTAVVVLVATITRAPVRLRWICSGVLAAAALAGGAALLPPAALAADQPKLTRTEVRSLYERALAHWIADHAGADGATVLAPPVTTSSFAFYGNLRGLGTLGWQNRDGLSASYRIVSSLRSSETQALVNQYGVTHIVLPSWDTGLDDLSRLGVNPGAEPFIYVLHHTDGAVYDWLRPLAYSLPEVPGFEESSVLVLAVSDEANPAVVHSRLVEYLIEMHRLDQAAIASRALLHYPSDLGAQVALAEYAKATGDDRQFSKMVQSIASYVRVGADRRLTWDRRASLAVVLALGGQEDLARTQVQKCVRLLDEERVREMTTGSLFHLLYLAGHFGVDIPDAKARSLAVSLLPAELRARL